MDQSPLIPKPFRLGPFVVIAAVVGIAAVAFAYTAGWLSPHRLTPKKLVAGLAPPGGPALGHRRNHAKGICFTGTLNANGDGSTLSKAQVFVRGQYPVVGRFNLATADPNAADAMVRVRGLGISITTPDGQEWRSAMIDAPIFPASTPKDFYGLLTASASKDPDAMKEFIAGHPGFLTFLGWAKSAPWTSSYAEERYNSLDSFLFVDQSGAKHPIRWSLIPAAQPVPIAPGDLAKRGPDYLEQEITQRVSASPQRWTLVITVANPGDPTADPNKAWPADRRTINAGTLIVQQIEPERDGPCRDINFDPTVLPSGITTSDDPFPAARSAAYSRSYNSRTAESSYYPRTDAGAKQ
ncbi:catalase [Silvibacterium bohemicum]|uniref:Catalase-related peroxidase n=1 Tax=Silvibacterium bohemicum TaxID=1577686 RepID=A0A841JV92_9BACT|nr:catalase family peroxidase [Silvibacterium bohemicum]MBB6145313.1 catalase [Silvibacterium bohemicum]